MSSSHISFSGLQKFQFCPHYYKLAYIDGMKFQGNLHTAFGKAVHETIEVTLEENSALEFIQKHREDIENLFKKNFKKELAALPEEEQKNISDDGGLREIKKDMMAKGGELSILAVLRLYKDFPGFKVIAIEEELLEKITEHEETEYDFKGLLDLAIRDANGKIHIIDWKTCSWGWKPEKRTDKMTTYQLTYYKHFYANKHAVGLKNIDCHFALIKRTAKRDKIEIFRVPVGERKINNALKVLDDAVYNIHNHNFIKNRLSCDKCEFNLTEHCKKR